MKKSLKDRVKTKIRRSKASVFMMADFKRLSDDNQVRRALRQLIAEGFMLRVGQGVYVKAVVSRFSGNIVPIIDIRSIAEEVLRRGV